MYGKFSAFSAPGAFVPLFLFTKTTDLPATRWLQTRIGSANGTREGRANEHPVDGCTYVQKPDSGPLHRPREERLDASLEIVPRDGRQLPLAPVLSWRMFGAGSKADCAVSKANLVSDLADIRAWDAAHPGRIVALQWWSGTDHDADGTNATDPGCADPRLTYLQWLKAAQIVPSSCFPPPVHAPQQAPLGLQPPDSVRADCSPSFPSGPPSGCAWTTSCTTGQPFWNTPYQGTSCTWKFTPTDIEKPLFLNATFRTAYAVNISIYDGASDAAPRLAFFEGAAMDPKADDGYLHAQGTGRELTVRLDADPKGMTFGLMFGFNLTSAPDLMEA